MTRHTIARRALKPALALATVGLLATAIAAPAAADEEIHITIGPAPDFVISHPTLTVEIGTVLRYTKANPSGSPFHIVEHLEVVEGLTYQQMRTRCAQPGFTACHWVDIVLTVAPPADIVGVPGPPPGGNALFYGTTITSSPHSFLWDTGVWHDQHVVGYLGKDPITEPTTLWLVDALNSQIVQQEITFVPRGWFDPTPTPRYVPACPGTSDGPPGQNKVLAPLDGKPFDKPCGRGQGGSSGEPSEAALGGLIVLLPFMILGLLSGRLADTRRRFRSR